MDSDGNLIIDTIAGFAEPLLADMGMELVEVQFRRENHGWVLRLFIDSEQGVTIDNCADVSREISAYLEVEELIEHAYNLEVSSPGAERPLKRKEDFIRFAGKKARIKMREAIDGQKVFIGILQAVDGDEVVLDMDGSVISLNIDDMSKARLTL